MVFRESPFERIVNVSWAGGVTIRLVSTTYPSLNPATDWATFDGLCGGTGAGGTGGPTSGFAYYEIYDLSLSEVPPTHAELVAATWTGETSGVSLDMSTISWSQICTLTAGDQVTIGWVANFLQTYGPYDFWQYSLRIARNPVTNKLYAEMIFNDPAVGPAWIVGEDITIA